jgi:hypothetical protein
MGNIIFFEEVKLMYKTQPKMNILTANNILNRNQFQNLVNIPLKVLRNLCEYYEVKYDYSKTFKECKYVFYAKPPHYSANEFFVKITNALKRINCTLDWYFDAAKKDINGKKTNFNFKNIMNYKGILNY